MRNIKFRGKSNGEWVYGLLLKSDKDDEYQYLIQSENEKCKCCGKELVKYFITDEETIGQYTGLKDKNETEIYEGDIVQSDIDRALVKWNDKYGYFQLVPIGDYYFDSDVIGQALEYADVEVIGNIYDNLELLEEGE